MKAMLSRMAGAALAGLLAASPLHANTIKFETIAPYAGLRNINPSRPLHTDGYTISDVNGEAAVFAANSGYSMIGDGSAIFGFAPSDTITLVEANASLFDLVRLMLGPSNIGTGSTTITLTGYGMASTIIETKTFTNLTTATLETLRWDDLSRVTITATTDSSFDNVIVRDGLLFVSPDTPVPEPATAALLAAGLIGLAALTRGRRAHASA